MRRAFTHGTLVAIALSLVIPSVLFLQPKKIEAQGETAAACSAGFGIGALIGGLGIFHDTVGVPVSKPESTTANVTQTSTSWIETVMKCVLKPLAMEMVRMIIDQVGNSMVEWINGGFQGSPKFIVDFEGLVMDQADKVIGQMIDGSELGWLCDRLPSIQIALATRYRGFSGYNRDDYKGCTLSDITDNVDDFTNGGWINVMAVSGDPRKDTIGAYMITIDEVNRRLLTKKDTKDKEIASGDGFLSDKKCITWETYDSYAKRTGFRPTDPNDREGELYDSFELGKADGTTVCLKYEITTPGKTIADKVTSALRIEDEQLGVADEIEEIINALAKQAYNGILKNVNGLLNGSRNRKSYKRRFVGVAEVNLKDYLPVSSVPDIYPPHNPDGKIDLNDYRLFNATREGYDRSSCFDGIDNNGVGGIDGDDPLCDGSSRENELPTGVTSCTDGADNDADSAIDLADSDCVGRGAVEDFTDDYLNNQQGNAPIVVDKNLLNSDSRVSASSGNLATNAVDGVTNNPTTFGGVGSGGQTDLVLWSNPDQSGTQMVRYPIVDNDLPKTFSVSPSNGTNPGASSIEFPNGYRVTLYGGGSNTEITKSVSNFRGPQITFDNGTDIHDNISSVKIEKNTQDTSGSSNEINPPMRTNPSADLDRNNQWWQADLEARYIVSKIVIYRNTLKTIPQTLGDSPLAIVISDTPGGSGTTVSVNLASAGNSNTLTITMPTNAIGRYVRIVKNGQPTYPLEFTEVEIWGKRAPTVDQDAFYTICDTNTIGMGKCSADEKAIAIGIGYRDAGIEGYMFPTQVSGTVPLYRFFNPTVTDHAYTTDAGQITAFTSAGFSNEGVEAYVHSPTQTQPSGTVPLYRLFNPVASDHFYTINPTVRDRMISLGYVLEREDTGGIEAYVYSTRVEGTVPLYKLLRGTY